jgi:hypothetical protein
MATVHYSFSAAYVPLENLGLAPALSVQLVYAGRRTTAVAILDSGSTFTVFNPEHAALIGIDDVFLGERARMSTQGGGIDYYIFQLEMNVQIGAHNNLFPCRVGFFDARRPRNILGRDLMFRHYEIGFRDTQEIVHFRQE